MIQKGIYTDTITAPKRVMFPYRGLSIEMDGTSGEIVEVAQWSESKQDCVPALEIDLYPLDHYGYGALAIATILEDINIWLDENPDMAEVMLEYPVFP